MSRLLNVRLVGLVVAIGTGVVMYETFRSPILGILFALGVFAAGMVQGRRLGGGLAILVAAGAVAAGSTTQVAHANVPSHVAIPANCKPQGQPGTYTPTGRWTVATWVNDPAYKACLNDAGPAWITRCAIGAGGGQIMTFGSVATQSTSWAMYFSKIADLNPWGLLVVAGAGCVVAQLPTG